MYNSSGYQIQFEKTCKANSLQAFTKMISQHLEIPLDHAKFHKKAPRHEKKRHEKHYFGDINKGDDFDDVRGAVL